LQEWKCGRVLSGSTTLSYAPTTKEIPLDRNDEIAIKMTTEREGCRRVIDRLLAAREFVCQGQSVLAASVEYELASKSIEAAKVTAENATSVKAALEAKVNATVDFNQGRFVSGTGLHYGIKVNPTCWRVRTTVRATCRETGSTGW
jgi:hypothetical protein